MILKYKISKLTVEYKHACIMFKPNCLGLHSCGTEFDHLCFVGSTQLLDGTSPSNLLLEERIAPG